MGGFGFLPHWGVVGYDSYPTWHLPGWGGGRMLTPPGLGWGRILIPPHPDLSPAGWTGVPGFIFYGESTIFPKVTFTNAWEIILQLLIGSHSLNEMV
jgi:hypothetical protein